MTRLRRFGSLALLSSAVATVAVARTRLEDYALMLPDPPLARQVSSRTGLHTVEARGKLARIRADQERLRRELAQRKFAVTGAVQTLANAIFVRASSDRLKELEALPGVARVVYLPRLHRHLDQAVGLVNAPAAWNLLGGTGKAGAGVKVAILDTGIDQTHPAFQDPSLVVPAGFPKVQPEFASYTNNKIIVARSYVSLLSSTDPQYSVPDDTSPRDPSGQGTAIANVAAGAQNAGPAATITGIAPKAWLGNYKIFGTPGVSGYGTTQQAVVQALEDAVNDGMDIAVLPFGVTAFYGYLAADCATSADNPQGICDTYYYPIEQAVANAISQGMTMVISAGNDGATGTQFPTQNTINTPGLTPAAITVGATTNSHIFFSTLSVTGSSVPSNLQNVNAVFGDGPKPSGTLTAPLVDVSTLGNDGLACAGLPAASLNSSFALIQRGDCTFFEKIDNAQAAGAKGVVIYQSAGNEMPFSQLGAQSTGIPAVMIGNADGTALKSYLQGHAGASVSLDPALRAVSASFNTVADFSSRGPVVGDSSIKPDLVAVGTDLYTATEKSDPDGDFYDPSGYTSGAGTSMAAAMVGGAAALVKQQNPAFSPAQIKSAVVNTATTDITDGSGQASVTAVGAGKLNVGAAVAVGVTVDPPTLSFGVVGSGSLPINRTLKITNSSSAPVTLNLKVEPLPAGSSSQLTVSPTSLNIAAGQQGTATATLQGSIPKAGSYEGAVTISAGSTTLRVPYLYLVGDGVPYNAFPIQGASFTGVPGDQGWQLGFRVVDQYGVPVTNLPVTFGVVSGDGTIASADGTTDKVGKAGAAVNLGSSLGDQIFNVQAGGLTVEFDGYSRPLPTISTGGVVNAASVQAGQGLAPGSYISIFGSGLSDVTASLSATSLPLSMAGASVSFDASGLSLPGRLSYASDGQINVQIPWEFQGRSSVQMKVIADGIPSAIYTVPLNDYAPAVFEYSDPASGRQLAAALDQNNALITGSHPAVRGQVVVIYANGLGPVNNQPASGEVSPAQPLADTRVVPTVTIGGKSAQVQFSGLTPSSIGLYQLNVVVPPDAGTGILPVVITANGIASKTSNLPVQ